MSLYLPYVAANFYPSWITLVPSAIIIGIGCTLLWGAQGTYFNECSVLYKELTDASTTSTPSPKVTYISNNEELSALDLLQKVDESQNPQENCENSPPKRVPTDGYIVSPLPGSLGEANATKKKENKVFKLHTSNRIQNKRNQKSGSLSSTNALFFGFHGLAYCSAQVWSNLTSFYVLSSGQGKNYNKFSHCSCGADFCNTDQECIDTRIEEVPAGIRYIYTGLCVACGIVAVLLIWLFVDHMDRSKGSVALSRNHIFSTIKFIKIKNSFL
ncbi:hypothetical protein AVEN_174762-1 [Araneus ventricosus]|uniref:Uncharacterized protein n=1 Tax=Araneus ventricosus TaxID=182803 RepID=A0A4Y2BKM6_ARAVE|nr:hypothetical protein AVEN_174762-1 [Araneus ventricosus]